MSEPIEGEVLPPTTELIETAKAVPASSSRNKAQRFRKEIADADSQIFENLPTVIEKIIEKALSGKGDTKLLMYVVDRCLGRPTEHQEVSVAQEWQEQVDAERKILMEESPDELARQYKQEISAGA